MAGDPARSHNARVVLVLMSVILGSLFLGISLLSAHVHPIPRVSGTPTVVAQIARAVYGNSLPGKIFFYLLQIATLVILVMAANTAFNGFPLLASFAAEDRFLPRQLTKRGHRLVFSNGIVVLTVVAVALIVGAGGSVTRLVSLYAIGVFTSFTMAGAGMVRYHLLNREKGWRWRTVINGSAALLSGLVTLVFITTKFTEGAWLVVVVGPLLVISFIALHNRYEREKAILSRNVPEALSRPVPRNHVALVLVERLDLATAKALLYARTLTDDVRAVHVVLDWQEARELERSWRELGFARLPLELVDCPDRRIGRTVVELVGSLTAEPDTEVSVLLARRVHDGVVRRILHDRTAERLASLLSNLERASATIVPFRMPPARRFRAQGRERDKIKPTEEAEEFQEIFEIKGAKGVLPIKDVRPRRRARVAGRVVTVTVRPKGDLSTLQCVLADRTGRVCLVFQGRRQVPGIEPGTRLIAEGTVGEQGNQLVILNPRYEIIGVPEPVAPEATQ